MKYSVSSPFSTSDYKSIMITTLLVVTCFLLTMLGIALQVFQVQKKDAEKILIAESKRYEKLINQLDQEYFKSVESGIVVFKIDKRPPKDLGQRFTQKMSVVVKKKSALNMGWPIYDTNIENSLLVRQIGTTDFLIALELPKHRITKNYIYIGVYASVSILLIMFFSRHMEKTKIQRRLRYINNTAKAVLNDDLERRIPVDNASDEFTELSKTLNHMLDRNVGLMHDLKQVNSNIAHDLRSPLNRMRSRIDVALLSDRSARDYQQTLSDSLDDIDDLLKTFEALLLMGNLDSNPQSFKFQSVALDDLVERLVEIYEAVAEEKSQTFVSEIESNTYIFANAPLFTQALSNLIDNAIKYTPKGGNISICVEKLSIGVKIIISDSGIGIPKEKHKEVFDRFKRLDSARQLPGTGLGMSLVLSILNLHKATIHLYDNSQGLRVEIFVKFCPPNIS